MNDVPLSSDPTPLAEGLPLVAPDAAEATGLDFDVAERARDGRTPSVVALGGSAGAIAALCAFFEAAPAKAGLAWVVVLHLMPDRPSMLPELLQRHTAMPVRAARDGMAIEADTVTVIPPGCHLTTVDDRFALTEQQNDRGRRIAVDLLFRSLADTHGRHAVAVVLSGADGDGATGLKRIKERGGLTIAQDPDEAGTAGMPTSAISTGMVDWVLPVADMPGRIVAYLARDPSLRMPPEAAPGTVAASSPEALPEQQLREVLSLVRTKTGHDFSDYKRSTLIRRISRRMMVCNVESLGGYVGVLREQPGEAGELLKDLLISVTNFFRDRDAFAAVERLLPGLFEGKGRNDSVRVWCAACATGEEAYSMAMLLLEQADRISGPPRLQVFACDLDEAAIQAARAGRYPLTIATDVSEERLERFFVREEGGYRVCRELREMVLFAQHDLLLDAPFSRMDFVSCRNLLIYLSRPAQQRVLAILHFASRPGGLLFLGNSETVDENAPYETIDAAHRIYRQRPARGAILPDLRGIGATATRRAQLHAGRRQGDVVGLPSGDFFPTFEARSLPAAPGIAPAAGDALHLRLLGRFGPASLVVDAAQDVVHLSENASRFLQVPSGEPTRNLLQLVHPALRVDLRAALLRVEETKQAVEATARGVVWGGEVRDVALRVVPAGELAPGSLLVFFEPLAGDAELPEGPPSGHGALTGADDVVGHLERALSGAQAELRATVERYELTTEELRAGNEELQAMNEELRSAGEELETSREELQSVNEELTTVNAEFQLRVEELARANSDLHNLMSATQIATVFLDRDRRVMRFTPAAAPLFNLIPGDVGRPISDLKGRLDYPELVGDVGRVLESLQPIERELKEDGHWYLARVLPYRTIDDRIAGVVISFVDVSDSRRAETALRESERKYRTLFESMDEGYCIVQLEEDASGRTDVRYLEVNRAFMKQAGVPDPTGRTVREALPRLEDFWVDLYAQVARTGESVRLERESQALGRVFDLYVVRVGEPAERKVAVLFGDVTERRRGEQHRRYLLRLSDALRPLADPEEIQATAMRCLGAHLRASRAQYHAVDADEETMQPSAGYADGVPHLAESVRIDDFGPFVKESLRAGQTLVVADVAADPRASAEQRAAYEEGGFRAFVGVPLVKAGRLVGVLSVHQASPRPWTAADVGAAEETAERTWSAVARSLAEKALRVREEQQTFLLRFGDTLRTAGPPAEIERTAMRLLGEHLGLSRVYHFRAEREAGGQVHTIDTAWQHDAAGPSILGRHAVRTFGPDLFAPLERGEVVAVADVARLPLDADTRASYDALHIAAFVNVPLIRDGELAEGIAAHRDRPHAWTADEIGLIRDVAERMGTFVERARLDRRQAFRLALDDAIQPLLDADEIRSAAMRVLGTALGADRALYADVTADGDAIDIAGDFVRESFPVLQGRVPLQAFGDHLLGTLRAGKTLTIADVEATELLPSTVKAAFRNVQTRALVGVPIVKQGRWVSTVALHQGEPRVWTSDETDMAVEAADRVWSAVGRALAERAMRESELRLRLAVEGSELGTWEWNLEAGTVVWNVRHFELFGMAPQPNPISPDAFFRHVHPDDRSHIERQLQEAIASDAPFVAQFRAVLEGGEIRWMNGYGRVVETVDERPVKMAGVMFDTTDAKRAEEALRDSEARLQSIADVVPDLLWSSEPDGSTSWSNDRWAAYTGDASKARPPRRWFDAVHPDERKAAERLHREAVERVEPLVCEVRIRAARGTYRWHLVRAEPLRGEGGALLRLYGSATDIHDLRLAGEALRASEGQMRAMAENLPGGAAFVVDRNMRYTLAGGEALRTAEKTGEDFVGRSVEDVSPELVAEYRKVLAGRSFESEHERQGRHYVSRGVPLRGADGRVVAALAVSYDISDRKRAEDALRFGEERLRLIVENAREYAIVAIDFDWRIVSWNSGAEAILGHAESEVLGRSADILYVPEDVAAGAPELERQAATATGRAADERWHLRRDGSRFWGSGSLMAMRDDQGEPFGFVKIFRDQTAEMEARQAIEHARDEAEAAGQAKDRFLAVLSHELRTPLTPVMMASQMIGRTKELPAHLRRSLDIIERNVRLQATLIDDLLDVTRIASGKMELRREAIGLHEVLGRAIEVSMPDIDAKQQALTVDLRAADDALQADPQRLQQLFWNLLKNASKFTPEGGRLAVRSRNDGPRIVVEVQDDGIGFETADAERIFDAFEQANRQVTRQFGGLGLGLAIASATVEAHGGRIAASSPGPNRGATFTVELPLREGAN